MHVVRECRTGCPIRAAVWIFRGVGLARTSRRRDVVPGELAGALEVLPGGGVLTHGVEPSPIAGAHDWVAGMPKPKTRTRSPPAQLGRRACRSGEGGRLCLRLRARRAPYPQPPARLAARAVADSCAAGPPAPRSRRSGCCSRCSPSPRSPAPEPNRSPPNRPSPSGRSALGQPARARVARDGVRRRLHRRQLAATAGRLAPRRLALGARTRRANRDRVRGVRTTSPCPPRPTYSASGSQPSRTPSGCLLRYSCSPSYRTRCLS